MSTQTRMVRGWSVLSISSDSLTVDIVPGKGGDILGVRTASGVDLLWSSPWGLRERGAAPTGVDPSGAFLASYAGGWQTIFPNGGAACAEHGTTWGFHGEAALAAWDVESANASELMMSTRLFASPFHLQKTVSVESEVVTVTETVTNEGSQSVETMWSHHPAFGAPLVGPGCTVGTSARTFTADDVPLGSFGDLVPGATSDWPFAEARAGGVVDLRELPGPGHPTARLGYLSDFADGACISLDNPQLGLAVEIRWDEGVMPHAWYWLEANATLDFPLYGRAYVLGLEPATSYPGQGLGAVRRTTGTQVAFQAGESRTAAISLAVTGQAARP